MPQIQNPEAVDIIREEAKLSLGDGFPQVLGNQVVPVMDMTPSFHRKANIVKSFTQGTSGSITIHTTSTGKKTYVVAVQLWYQKDATSDNTSVGISATVNGVSTNLLSIRLLTTTASSQCVVLPLPNPVLIDEGTNITCFGSFTAGSLARSGVLYAYEI